MKDELSVEFSFPSTDTRPIKAAFFATFWCSDICHFTLHHQLRELSVWGLVLPFFLPVFWPHNLKIKWSHCFALLSFQPVDKTGWALRNRPCLQWRHRRKIKPSSCWGEIVLSERQICFSLCCKHLSSDWRQWAYLMTFMLSVPLC